MKEAIGGVPIFQIVIIFILLFTGIMSLTINRSKAFGVKDEAINIVQSINVKNDVIKVSGKYELNNNTITDVVNLLSTNGYRSEGNCPDTTWVGYNSNGQKVLPGKNAVFCVKSNDVTASYVNNLYNKCQQLGANCSYIVNDMPRMIYFDIVLFYDLDVPVLHNVFNFRVTGSTKLLFEG